MTRPKATCSIEGCTGTVAKRGWCNRHYLRWYRHGDPLAPGHHLRGDLLASIETRIDRSRAAPCWLWLGKPDPKNYGRIMIGKRNRLVYTVVYEMYVGPVPEGMSLDHVCHNEADPPCLLGNDCPHRLCVNPDHLAPKPIRENVLAGNGPTAINARKTHCVHGHEFTPENTIWTRKGNRRCRACKNLRGQERYARKKATASPA